MIVENVLGALYLEIFTFELLWSCFFLFYAERNITKNKICFCQVHVIMITLSHHLFLSSKFCQTIRRQKQGGAKKYSDLPNLLQCAYLDA